MLANINKNVLIAELKEYARSVGPGGHVMISGFYTHDTDDLKGEAVRHGLTEVRRDEREGWALLLLQKR